MITRVSEALVRPGREQEFVERVRELVATFPATYEGLISHDVLVDLEEPQRVQYVSR